jgi:hypothetical protein
MLTLRRVFQAFATLAALGLCSAGAAGCGGKPTPPAGAPVGKSPTDAPDEDKIPADAPVVSLTADQFFQEVRKDEKAAERFKNKRIELSGEVSSFMGFFERNWIAGLAAAAA